jgi:N-acetylglucosamine kinase-like BadF-type ATPase
MKYVLGVDAGNSKTIALVSTITGEVVGSGRSECGDIYNTKTPQHALKNVDQAVRAALRAAGIRGSQIASAAFSMAGADWPEDFSLITTALSRESYCKLFVVANDAVGALHSGAIEGWGVSIANGTGAAVCARSRDGRAFEMSWWQEGGGGRSLGFSGLRAVYRSDLGIDAATALTERILAFCGSTSVEDLLHMFTRREAPAHAKVPTLARIVLDAARDGDVIANEIVRADGTSLGDYVLAAARKVGIEDEAFPLILTGSVFKHDSTLLVDAILQRVRSRCPSVYVQKSELEPGAGALIMALNALDIEATEEVRARLKATLPSVVFFAT